MRLGIILMLGLLARRCQSRPADIIEAETEDPEYDDIDLEIYQPQNLKATELNKNSILLEWDLDEEVEPSEIESYRIYYKHTTFQDVITIRQSETTYVLTGLVPYTNYEIWVESIFNGTTVSRSSEPIFAQTDVDKPGAPVIVNASCYATGSIFIEWERPDEYDRSIDFYTIYFRSLSNYGQVQNVTVNSDANTIIQNFQIQDLKGNDKYVIKIRAGTKSLSRPNDEPLFGDASNEVQLFLPLENCQVPTSMMADSTNYFQAELNAGMIVGAVCAVLFLLLAVIGFVVWRQYFKAAYYYLDEPHRIVPPATLPDWENAAGPEGGEESGAITVKDFATHVAALHADTDAGFAKEYSDIQKYCLKQVKATFEHSLHPDNKCKNRYLNIVAYDHSRVRLLPVAGQKKTSDYINANYIDGFQKANAYIGTQGPLSDTCEAFWRMIWEQNVYVVVMITNLLERGRRKCDQYWPKAVEESETYGNIEVVFESEEVTANYTVRTMRMKHLKLKRKKGMTSEREIKQFHYTSWPDHGVPCHPLPVLSFIRKSAASNPADGGPIIVHCSAGVGRTGTYIAIDSLLQQARAKTEFNVYGFLKHIRGQRNHLVQTEEQYVFIHDALLEAIRSGVTEIDREDVAQYVDTLLKEATSGEFEGGLVVEDGESLLDAQFKLVTEMQPSEYHYMSAQMECNQEKNRQSSLIPLESSRIPLAPKPGVEGSDYINASWLHGHEKLKEFIITQHPTLNVKEDFWRMLWDHNAQTVVLLSPLEDSEFPVFWPLREKDFELETFRVRFVDEAVHEGYSSLDFVVSSQHDDYELAVRIIHCPDWSHSLPKVNKNFDVLKLVQDWHLEYQDGPLVVVDKNGGTEAATFCSLTTLCKQLESYNAVDVYQVAKLYHNKRPGIWKSADDFLYLYKAIDALIASNQSNPLQPPQDKDGCNGGAATATTSVADAPINSNGSSSGQSSLVPPERRHSTSASDWSPNGSIPKKNSANVASRTLSNGSGHSRRHSLPNGNGCITLKETTSHSSAVTGDSSVAFQTNNVDDEEEEEISETAALTAV